MFLNIYSVYIYIFLFKFVILYILTHFAIVEQIVLCMYIMFHNTLALAMTSLMEIKCTFYKVIVNE